MKETFCVVKYHGVVRQKYSNNATLVLKYLHLYQFINLHVSMITIPYFLRNSFLFLPFATYRKYLNKIKVSYCFEKMLTPSKLDEKRISRT